VVWGADRPAAIARMARALGEYKIVGVRTTIPVLERIVAHPDFHAGRLSTSFLDRVLASVRANEARFESVAVIAAVLAEYERARRPPAAPAPASDGPTGPWRLAARPAWRRR